MIQSFLQLEYLKMKNIFKTIEKKYWVNDVKILNEFATYMKGN